MITKQKRSRQKLPNAMSMTTEKINVKSRLFGAIMIVTPLSRQVTNYARYIYVSFKSLNLHATGVLRGLISFL